MADTTKEAAAKKHEAEFMSMGNDKFNHELLALVKSRQPLIYLTTNEEQRLIVYLQNFCVARGYQGYIWDCYKGLCNITDMKKAEIAGDDSGDVDVILDKVIENIEALENSPQNKKNERGAIFVLLGFDRFIKPNCSPDTERRLKWIVRFAKKVSVILIGSSYCDTPSIQKDMAVLDFPYPNEVELKQVLWQVVESVLPSFPGLKEKVEKIEEELINSVKGMTIAEAQLAFSKSVVMCKMLKHDPLETKRIIQEKRQIIRKSGILEFFDTDLTAGDVGGLDILMDWLKLRKLAFTHDARTYGLDAPRGILLLGHPGTGKSLSAKATASEYGIPLLRLDFGRLFGSLVGDSERNARDAISLAEALAPCVSGSSIVYDASGKAYTIEDLCDPDAPAMSNFFVYALNEQTNQLERTSVKAVVRKPKKPMIRLRTHAGAVEVTHDHKMLVLNNGKTEWIDASSLKVGDYLIAPKKFKRDVNAFAIAKALPPGTTVNDRDISYKDETGTEHAITLAPDFCLTSLYYIVGMLDACGEIDPEKETVSFTGKSNKDAQYFCHVMQSNFGIEPALDGHTATVDNKLIFEIFWEASDALLAQSDHRLVSYLAGYLDVAGQIKPQGRKPKILFVSHSLFVRERIRRALHALGILDLHELESILFLDVLSEVKKLCGFLDVERPIHRQAAKLVESIRIVSNVSKDYKTVGALKQDQGNVIVHTQEEIVGVKLLSIDDAGEQWCYDLACEGNHNFFANGLCCHNCILWTDELEKGLSGSKSSGDTDGGTTSRVISTFLTWMQEKTAPVFVMATANNVEDIPPEFMRAGRFDECFFVGLPGVVGRKQIFNILLRRKKRDAKNFDLDALSKASEKYSGAEIEKAINLALFKGYSDKKREITTDDVIEAIASFQPLSVTREVEFKERESWAKSRCLFANTPDDPSTVIASTKKAPQKLDLS